MKETEIQNANIKSNKKIYAFNVIIIILIFIILFGYMINVEGLSNIENLLKTANYKWVLLGFLCLIGMWISEAITIQSPLKKIYPDQKFCNTFKITMIGQLFNNLTPFASGGQLMQSYVMYKEGKRASDSLSVLSMRFVITQTILIVFTILVVISQFNFFKDLFKDLVWIGIIGIILNILLVIILIIAGTNKNFILKIVNPLIGLVSKIHIGKFKFIKDKEETINHLNESVSNYSYQFKYMNKNKKTIAIMAIFGFIQSVLYYAITYTVYKTFGNSGSTFLQIITTQAFLMLIMTLFPTPRCWSRCRRRIFTTI